MEFHAIEEAIYDLMIGKVIIVVDDENRENEGDFIALAEKATPEIINFMIREGRGLVCVPITSERAQELNLPPMIARNTENHCTAFTISVDHEETTTGISVFDRARTVKAIIDPKTLPQQLCRPGHIFPLIAKKGGVLQRAGHTEAAVDLATLCGSYPAAVICEIINEDGTMARVPDLMQIAKQHHLKIITIQDLIHYRIQKEILIKREVEVKMPTDFGTFTAIAYSNQVDQKEYIALVKGNIEPSLPALVHIHSECPLGDIFHSNGCNCGPQLEIALKHINEADSGMLLYTRQEGRGMGLINKLKAFPLQEQGLDTVNANNDSDLREYGICAQILKNVGVRQIRLMTNHPTKVRFLERYGMDVVERVPFSMLAQLKDAKESRLCI
ncbi:3,4-dihydroxy-2-butanone-4-phosphate synthase [Paenibacillus frigoriresistens]|uniref:3,4-dihydroxy-2-butanone-4-phosphate synthase n=1 Tax=Paenibacillus alginolyticus TaxID=59839 RepID=UPI001563C774|nr:3,4-dihydroxy-2-butanone-4-phosphate synthase [Paenibacillus frigoriresistens]NRF94398.1 3,4-dihydroxy-2-butanone-4-phosphate synthase [Paenibacillus frigoriresistens]